MPIYEFTCKNCGTFHEFIIGLSEMPDLGKNRSVDLAVVNIKCKKCKKTKFKKLISSHGKTAINWAAWQNGPVKPTVTKAPKSKPKVAKPPKKS